MPPDFVAGLDGWKRPLDTPAAARVKQVARQQNQSNDDCYGMSGSETSLFSTGLPSSPSEKKIVPPPPKLLGML